MTPPRAPRRLSWAIAGRLAGRAFAGVVLVWMVGLVAWPVQRIPCKRCEFARDMSQLDGDAGGWRIWPGARRMSRLTGRHNADERTWQRFNRRAPEFWCRPPGSLPAPCPVGECERDTSFSALFSLLDL